MPIFISRYLLLYSVDVKRYLADVGSSSEQLRTPEFDAELFPSFSMFFVCRRLSLCYAFLGVEHVPET